jgi:hypothetical protein
MKYFFLILFSLLFFISRVNEAQIIINGDLTESAYQLLSTRLNTNGGFAPDCDLTKVYYYVGDNNFYLGVECRIQSQPNLYNPLPDGLGIFFDFSSRSGLPAGSALGINEPYDYHFLNGALEVGGPPYILEFKADFEVDYLFAVYTDATPNNIFFDAASQSGSTQGTIQNIGTTDQYGTVATGPDVNGIFNQNSIEFAFQQSPYEGSLRGFEVRIPFSEISATSNDEFKIFVPIVSSTAYFSNQTIPGNVLSGNPGFVPDFLNNLISLSCGCPNPGATIGVGPYHTMATGLPVEMVSFTARQDGVNIILDWSTASELNNLGFEVERKILDWENEGEWFTIGFVNGNGTTTELKAYYFNDQVEDFEATSFKYKLKQIDFDGSFEYSNEINVEIDKTTLPDDYFLLQNYPNPFNPTTTIKFELPVKDFVQLKIFDALGVEVARLVDEERAAGSYEVPFNAAEFGSGVYFYSLSAGSFIQTKKMILLK